MTRKPCRAAQRGAVTAVTDEVAHGFAKPEPSRRPSAAVLMAMAVGLIGVGVTGAGCGGPPPPPEVPAAFPVAALASADSASGHLHVELHAVPDPMVRGQNVGQFVVTDASGLPVDGLSLKVMPWMPADGHGTSVQPAITSTEVGVFIANPLYLFMAGEWELRMTFEGDFSDTATATVAIP